MRRSTEKFLDDADVRWGEYWHKAALNSGLDHKDSLELLILTYKLIRHIRKEKRWFF